MLPGSFTSLLLQIANRSNLAAEYLLKPFHFRIGERSRRSLTLRRLADKIGRRLGGWSSRDDLDLHRTAENAADRLVDIVWFHAQPELLGRREAQLARRSCYCRVLHAVGREGHPDLH